ncbi:MAG TPA: ribonuclease H-like domain-containing protein [Candidatus Paceibacterota bacterium]
MRKVVFDIETKNIFQDVGSNNPEDLDISVVGVYDYETDKYLTFLQEEFDKMWSFFKKADVIITFNGEYFDIPLLNKYYKKAGHGDLKNIRSLDIFKEVKQTSGRWLKLDKIAEGTFGINKVGDGLEAVKWWRTGEIDKIKKYCTEDVKITKDVYEFALKNKKIMYKEGPFVKEIKLETKHWEPIAEVKTQSLF